MLLVEHRVNTLEKLSRVPKDRGIEIDLRADGDRIVLAHDPFCSGERLEALLAAFDHALVIFNVKCDGLEARVAAAAADRGIESYFFLDVANPTLVQMTLGGERRVAVRYSEHEPIESALAFAGSAEWVWVDCFSRLPLDPATYERLHRHFKICIVSPELQGHPSSWIQGFKRQLVDLPIDAVCTDLCEEWKIGVGE